MTKTKALDLGTFKTVDFLAECNQSSKRADTWEKAVEYVTGMNAEFLRDAYEKARAQELTDCPLDQEEATEVRQYRMTLGRVAEVFVTEYFKK
jgi:hypothetical protein